jgi:hypothetical protein
VRSIQSFLGPEGAAFRPDDLQLMSDAFDDAWKTYRASDGVNEGNREDKRAVLARRVVDLACAGRFDKFSLRDAALGSLGVRRIRIVGSTHDGE